MEIIKFNFRDMPKVVRGRRKANNPDIVAIRSLLPGEAVKFDCRWNHTRGCHGSPTAHAAAKSEGFTIFTSCINKVFYAGRMA
jgi:hypothetical protein